MNVFYGGAIQGNRDRKLRQAIHRGIIQHIKALGHSVLSEHVTGASYEESIRLMTRSLGELPPKGAARTRFVRNKMIELVEGDLDACVFEVSVPSLGTGIEIAHAYLRPRLNLTPVPILALYEKDFWPQNLSAMISGISPEQVPDFSLAEYTSLDEACHRISRFLQAISK